MTEPTAAAPAPQKASLIEDFVDIFASPAAVFRRRAAGGWGLAFLIIVILNVGVFFAMRPALGAAMHADAVRTVGLMAKRLPNATPDQLEAMQQRQENSTGIGAAIVIPISILLVGFLTWICGKLFGSKADLSQSTMIATFATMPKVVALLVVGVQGFLIDPTKVTGMMSLGVSPARFMNPDAGKLAMLAFASRFDVFIIWATILLGVGIYAVGNTKKDSAALAAFLVWLIATALTVGPTLLLG